MTHRKLRMISERNVYKHMYVSMLFKGKQKFESILVCYGLVDKVKLFFEVKQQK